MVDVRTIIAYENGDLTAQDTLTMFAELVATGLAWQLQGSIYGRPAANLIDAGYVTRDGQVTPEGREWADNVDAAQAEDDEAWLELEA